MYIDIRFSVSDIQTSFILRVNLNSNNLQFHENHHLTWQTRLKRTTHIGTNLKQSPSKFTFLLAQNGGSKVTEILLTGPLSNNVWVFEQF